MTRPGWVPNELYPFEDRYLETTNARLHYIDEGDGPALLLLHGNPTWSFLYRDIIKGLRDRFRCIAVDQPGFGLSQAGSGYTFSPREHAAELDELVTRLDIKDAGMMVQDWGGPVGMWVATRHPERFTRFIIGNTWAWPLKDFKTKMFSGIMGGPIGGFLIQRRNMFIESILPGGVKSHKLPEDVMNAYRGPFPTIESRHAVHVLPRAITHSADFLGEIESGLSRLRDRPALILWPTADVAFGDNELKRWEETFVNHKTVKLDGAGHYIQEDQPNEIITAIRGWVS